MWTMKSHLYALRHRSEITKHTKFNIENIESFVVSTNKRKLYDYYKCDYCNGEIRLDKKQEERTGGIVKFPHTLTKCGQIELALCNKCLNKAINEFTKEE